MDYYNKKTKKVKMRFPEDLKKFYSFESGDSIESDVLGSYTGVPEDGGEPVQDSDDL